MKERKEAGADEIVKRRYDRLAQAKHRCSAASYVTLYEDAVIVLAWEAGLLSEGQASRALGVDRVEARERRDGLLAAGLATGDALWRAARE